MPRVGLTPAKVVDEAAATADEVGWQGLTLALVAERLGVRLPSLYKHIASLEALRADVRAQATRELADTMARGALGRSGGEALRGIADAWRDWARSHPGRYQATVAAPDPAHAEHVAAAASAMEVVEATLRGYRLEGDDAVDAARAVRAALHGFVDIETGGGFGIPVDIDRSFARLVAGLDAMLRSWVG